LSIIGNNTGSTADLRAAAGAIAAASIKPVIDRVFPLAQIRDAYRYLASGAHVGKIVIDLKAP
jgi:D-arabinose 1-dehydrogenase-like Zn-dependent alcohol dehydrogenase